MKSKITFTLLGLITLFIACNKKSDLPQYKVEEAVLEIYKYRAEKPDSLFSIIEGVEPNTIIAPVKQYGPVDLYNLEKVVPLEDGNNTVYEATYKVIFKAAEGTETFKVRRVKKLDGIVVGYSNDIKPSSPKTDSITGAN